MSGKLANTISTDTMGQQVKAHDDFEVHCYCRMPELKNVGMIECTSCSKWFHLVCGDVPTQVLNDQPHGIVIFVIARLLCIYPANTCGIHTLTCNHDNFFNVVVILLSFFCYYFNCHVL